MSSGGATSPAASLEATVDLTSPGRAWGACAKLSRGGRQAILRCSPVSNMPAISFSETAGLNRKP